MGRSMSDAAVSTGIDRPAILLGAGGHGRVLIELMRQLGMEILFIADDDARAHGKVIEGLAVRGGEDAVLACDASNVLLVNGVGSVGKTIARRRLFGRYTDRGYRFASLIHPSAVVSPSAKLASGVQVMAGAVLQAGVRVSDNVLINTRASVDHDCIIGAHVHVAPGATLSGAVNVGEGVHIGTGATVIENISIGREAVVAAGAVVVGDVTDGSRVMGVPAKPA